MITEMERINTPTTNAMKGVAAPYDTTEEKANEVEVAAQVAYE